ncbi:MAG: hypothetical protein ACOYJQ_04635 [Pseudochelatococcus sp.]|jgi:hypothetical protein|uniref:hypothetical protein n=1 Tax=Pseudochelatococcus sp. TaxID=2020869 RepID=UPI003D91ADF6
MKNIAQVANYYNFGRLPQEKRNIRAATAEPALNRAAGSGGYRAVFNIDPDSENSLLFS